MGNPFGRQKPSLDDFWEYFWSKVDWDSNDTERCWEWQGTKTKFGHGLIGIQGKRWLVHRYVYQEMVGPLTNGLAILHSCDNPPCVNPRHLEEGTRTKNQQDMQARGRSRARHWGKGGLCVNGHPWNDNEYFYKRKRVCRSCKADEQRARRARKKAA
jgi:hypothetical protein